MVSSRSKALVKAELEKLGLHYRIIEQGEVDISGTFTKPQRLALILGLKKNGFELVDEKASALVEKTKLIIVEFIHYADVVEDIDIGVYLSQKLKVPLSKLSETFTRVKGISIEQYFKIHRIERLKEMLIYGRLSLQEIMQVLNFKSISVMRNEFKKNTGLTPSFFRSLHRTKSSK